MNRPETRLLFIGLAGAFGLMCLAVSEKALLSGSGPLVATAEAIIGRPLTPLSYAGVARRTTRRAVGAGAAVGAVGAAAVARPVSGCVQAVDAYGRIYTRCY